jgi:hypothetical protein
MKRSVLAIALLAGTIFGSHLNAQTAPDNPASGAATPVDPSAVQALQKLGTSLQSLKRFHVSIDLTGERVLEDGEKLQHTATAELDVDRPNRIRAVMQSARSDREIFYNGKTVWLYQPAQKYYSAVAFDGNLTALIQQLRIRYDVEFPLADLFIWGTPDAPTDQFESAMNAGQDYIGQDICDHYAFRLNVNRNVNVNAHVDHRGGWDDDYHPVATAAAVTATVAVTSAIVGSMVNSVPPNCAPVNYGGMVYQRCGSAWYQPRGRSMSSLIRPTDCVRSAICFDSLHAVALLIVEGERGANAAAGLRQRRVPGVNEERGQPGAGATSGQRPGSQQVVIETDETLPRFVRNA